MSNSPTRTLLIAGAASLVATAIWVALAWRTPSSTFHFAPFIAAGVGPYVAKSAGRRLGLRHALTVGAISLSIVGLALAALILGDRLQGPTFWSEDGAALEAALFAIIGGIAGLALLARRSAPTGA